MNFFSPLGLACILNKLRIKVKAWYFFKQTNTNKSRFGLFIYFLIKFYYSRACSWIYFFSCLDLASLLNKPKAKVLTWLVFKQTKINEYRLGLFFSSPIVNELVHDFFLGLSRLLNKLSYLSLVCLRFKLGVFLLKKKHKRTIYIVILKLFMNNVVNLQSYSW